MSHNFKIHNRLNKIFTLLVVVTFGVISTLGTNGDDDGNGVNPVTYIGLESQAQVTSDNAQEFGEIAFLGVTVTGTMSPDAVQLPRQDVTHSASMLEIIRMLHSVLSNVDDSSDLSASSVGWMEVEPPMPGLCGGSVSSSIDVNESTMEFSGNITFSNWCNNGFTMNGVVTFTGTCDATTFDPSTQTCDIIDYVMTFNTFTASEMDFSIAMTGTMDTTTTSTGYETILNLLVRDDNANRTFKYENYVTTVTLNSPSLGYDSVEVTGNVYHPDYGYVVVSTPTPVQFTHDSMESTPHAGVVLLTGADGSVGPTMARFTFIDMSSYRIEVDTNGDTIANITWSCTWEPDQCSMV